MRRSFLIALIGGAALLGGSCGEPAAKANAAAAVRTGAGSPDLAFVTDPVAKPAVVELGNKYSRRIGEDGAFRANKKMNAVVIQRQRRAWDVVAAGVAQRDPRLVETGLKAIEWGLAQAKPDGSFPIPPGKRAGVVLPQAFFLNSAGRSLLLVRNANLGPALTRRAASLEPALARSARWLANTPDLAGRERDASNTNQIFVAGGALQVASALTGDAALAARAQQVVRSGLARQRPDGVFPEHGGFDSNYQVVSLNYLSQYAALLPPGPWRQQVLAAIGRGAERFTKVVDQTSGRISDATNTRTVACGEDQDDAEGMRLRLRYIATVLDRPAYKTLADRVGAAGQRFDHAEDCAGGGDKAEKKARKRRAA